MTDFNGSVEIKNTSGSAPRIKLDGDNRVIMLYGIDGKVRMRIGEYSDMDIPAGEEAVYDSIFVMNRDGEKVIRIYKGTLELGGVGYNGYLSLMNKDGNDSIVLAGGNAGKVVIKGNSGNDSIVLDGSNGDIVLNNADCAEEFDMSSCESMEIEPGSVMVFDDKAKLRKCSKEYDTNVAGVISGAGGYQPGLVLDRKQTSVSKRMPLALVGKTYCKVDALQSSIKVGDILTTSSTPGHAMKATNRSKAFGAVIGKALHTVNSGKALIPILIALQ